MDKVIVVDTNVLIRYFLRDIPAQTRVADELMKLVKAGEIKIWLSPWVIGELIWVLSSVYDKSREFIIDILKALMATSGVIIPNQKLVAEAIFYYIDKNIDFEDAMIALEARKDKVAEGISFDKHFNKFSWLKKWQPEDISNWQRRLRRDEDRHRLPN
jgi:predicted nucleic-acid-binding protein